MSYQKYDFRGQTFLVTGGTGILGGELACALVRCGANVVILDRDPDRAERYKDRLDCGPGVVRVLYADVTDRKLLINARRMFEEEFDRLDGLVNAAGGNTPEATTTSDLPFFNLPPEAFEKVINLNLMGTVLTCQIFGELMANQGEGVILNFSSMNAFRPLTRIPAYSAAKAAVTNFTQWLAVHMAMNYSPGIRVNAVAPGFMLTEQNRFLLYSQNGELSQRGKSILTHTPMGKFGQPEDVTEAALWLLSPFSAFVTGIVLPVDGGFSAFSGV